MKDCCRAKIFALSKIFSTRVLMLDRKITELKRKVFKPKDWKVQIMVFTNYLEEARTAEGMINKILERDKG